MEVSRRILVAGGNLSQQFFGSCVAKALNAANDGQVQKAELSLFLASWPERSGGKPHQVSLFDNPFSTLQIYRVK